MESVKLNVLNLGCGLAPLDGAVNHDRAKHHAYVDVIHDLNVLPWPWKDEEFDTIKAWAVLEHLYADRLLIIDECWRILKPGGVLVAKLPYWNSEAAHDDITHYWFTTLNQFAQFDPETQRGKEYGFYSTRKWKLLSSRFNRAHTSIVHKLEKRP